MSRIGQRRYFGRRTLAVGTLSLAVAAAGLVALGQVGGTGGAGGRTAVVTAADTGADTPAANPWDLRGDQEAALKASCLLLLGNSPANWVPVWGTIDEARACGIVIDAAHDSLRISWQVYERDKPAGQRQRGGDDQHDALRHCLWQGLMTERNWNHDPWIARVIGNDHEIEGMLASFFGWDADKANATKMDIWNNAVARRAAQGMGSDQQVISFCTDAAADAHFMTEASVGQMSIPAADSNTADYLIYFGRDTF